MTQTKLIASTTICQSVSRQSEPAPDLASYLREGHSIGSIARTNVSDGELVQRLREGSQTALLILYQRYGTLVYTLALRLLQQKTEAEALTQEVFLSFWQLDQVNFNRVDLRTYLCRFVRSLALKQLPSLLGKCQAQQPLQNSQWHPISLTALESSPPSNQSHRMQQVIKQLSPPQRQILEMKFYQGLSCDEIAQQLNMPLDQVKFHIRNSLMEFHQTLKKNPEPRKSSDAN